MTKCEPVEAWHFLKSDKKLGYKSGRLVRPGQTIKVKGRLNPCMWGLHASINAEDALHYAPGPIVCRVLCSEEIIHNYDKICARKRKCLWMADATKVFQKFSLNFLEEIVDFYPCKEENLQLIECYKNYHENKINKFEYYSILHDILPVAVINSIFNIFSFSFRICQKNITNNFDLCVTKGVIQEYLTRKYILDYDNIPNHLLGRNALTENFEDLLWTLKP